MKKAPTGKQMSKAMKPTAGQIAKHVLKTSAKEFMAGFWAFGKKTSDSIKKSYRAWVNTAFGGWAINKWYKAGKKAGEGFMFK